MKKSLLLLLLLMFCTVSAQQQTVIPNGTLTLKTDEKITFANMRFKGNQIVFNDLKDNKERTLELTEVKAIEGKAITVDQAAPAPKTVVPEIKDSRFRPNYPDGIYATKEDFINKKPSSAPELIAKELAGFEKERISGIVDHCFFYYAISDEKIKNVFAISYKGHLFFQLEAILKNRNKTDRAQTNSQYNQFTRVTIGGEHYFYAEANLANQWAQGFAYGGMGAAGAIAAQGMQYDKGIVWDFKNQEFNIFKNCKDYNDFIVPLYPEGKLACKSQQPDLYQVRNAMQAIK
ncbi:MAG: hypothetical protein EOO48_06900 [Flavobacterium sp.]|nr:MAG: hypothetical protein EOO48_06900 [Flavobacterium sp.]